MTIQKPQKNVIVRAKWMDRYFDGKWTGRRWLRFNEIFGGWDPVEAPTDWKVKETQALSVVEEVELREAALTEHVVSLMDQIDKLKVDLAAMTACYAHAEEKVEIVTANHEGMIRLLVERIEALKSSLNT